jgi:hypothetical protein
MRTVSDDSPYEGGHELEEIQIKSTITVAGLLTVILLAPASSLACSALGPNKHVGTVIGTDSAAHYLSCQRENFGGSEEREGANHR